MQKALYPEGADTCHVAVLHPPGGIAGGDSLYIGASLGAQTRAVLTTPGATKWYRSESDSASQQLSLRVGGGAVLEWLPRENILFNGSNCTQGIEVDLSPDAIYVGWDIFCFGRRASGESWSRGRLLLHTRVRRDGALVWAERADIEAAGGFADSPVGLSGYTVCGTFIAAAPDIPAALQSDCRELPAGPAPARSGITRLPGLLIARYLGGSTEEVFRYFTALWGLVRHVLLGRAACLPRVWAC